MRGLSVSRRRLSALATAGAGLLLAACAAPKTPGGDGNQVSRAAGAAPTDSGGQLSLVTPALPDTLSPTAGYGMTGTGKINEGLYGLEAGGRGLPRIVPVLAAGEPDISADARTWTVRLRDDLQFSDGRPCRATDVAATYRYILDPASASKIAEVLDVIHDVEAPDDRTVVFRLGEPWLGLRTLLMIGVAPAAQLPAGRPEAELALNRAPVGTGPYLMERFSADRLVLAANPRWRNPAPAVTRLTYVLAEDDNTRAQRLTAGEFDGTVLPPRLTATFRDKPEFKVTTATSADWRGISLPKGNPVTADPAVRMALNVGINRRVLVDKVLAGFGREAHTPLPAQFGAYHNPAAAFTYDPDRAARLLDQGGWTKGPDGIRTRDGRRAAFTVLYNPTDSLRRDVAQVFAAEALTLGFDIRLEGQPFSAIPPRLQRDAVVLGGGDMPYDPDTQLGQELSSRYPGPTGDSYYNVGRFASQEADHLLQVGRTSPDQATREAAYRRLQDLYVAEPSMLFLVFVDHTYVERASTAGRWRGSATVLEPHEHGVDMGPWVNVEQWKPA